ncbi:S9 family peptidase [Pseudokineococcus sp. 1T1Z-3]|uniref:S9 family peptidase n=1 Tax=Pseudokineococcus sp. 1T1Z-3 TaxID=3132745 RepID=UPI0030B63D1A
MTTAADQPAARDPLADLDAYVAQPRVTGLALSPDGRRLALAVAGLDAEGTGYATSLWESSVEGGACRRLTRGTTGEAAPFWTPQGDLLFTAKRPEPAPPKGPFGPGPDEDDATPGKGGDDRPALWCLPGGAGEPRLVASRPGGLTVSAVARGTGALLGTSPTMPSTPQDGDDAEVIAARKDAGVTAVLHDASPVRFWDHDLGPARARLVAADALGEAAPVAGGPDPRYAVRDLTGHVGAALERAEWDLSDDGRTAVGTWTVPRAHGHQSFQLVAVDVPSGRRVVLLDDPDLNHGSAVVSPDGGSVALVASSLSTPDRAPRRWLAVVDLHRDDAGAVTGAGERRDVTAGWDRWPSSVAWTRDGGSLVVGADEAGAGPLFVVDAASGDVRRLTGDHASYGGAAVSPDGWVYALRSAYDAAPAPVRVRLDDGTVEELPSPVAPLVLPGRLEEVHATAEDGTPIRSYLCLPEDASAEAPAPLLLWVHGGPLNSWNAWSWRWNPWLMVSRGYAVLLPDPALSTGYGQDFVQRGWGAWGAAPYTDLMAATDAAEAREDVDATRTAAMGGSFGGYMANWIAGHTDRFDAVVTHASIWALDQFGATTDAAFFWNREMTPQMAQKNSPHLFADQIRTPMLVVHGDKDYRVPIGEGLRLWWDLVSRSDAEDGSTPHRFLYFPAENHWVMAPGGAVAWYQTVLAFLDQHVLGKAWVQPDRLG